ncbi:MAG: hypothetical protein NXH96_19870, partial [Alteromonadaceae bacterium]|nr:hypothetical protein [Alteromonadaceae bacterium]
QSVTKAIGNAFIQKDIKDANLAGQSNWLATGFALKFSLDHNRPVTEVDYADEYRRGQGQVV